MALLDFLKKRSQAQAPVAKPSQVPKRETAKEMYSREAAAEKATRNPVEQMPEAERAHALETGAILNRATQHLDKGAQAPSAEPADGMSNQSAMRQNMTAQEKHSPALSPTSGQAGKTASEKRPVNTQQKARPGTLPRTAPSWER